MGHCLYYLPGVTSDVDKAFDASGLSDRLNSYSLAPADRGPDDKGGMLLSGDEHNLRYKPDVQTWAGPFNDGRYWVGVWNDSKPGPDDLKRPEQIPGTPVELLDGREWLIPAWRLAPMALTMGMDGEVVQEPLPVCERLQACVQRLGAMLDGKTEAQVDMGEVLGVIADALAVNYRIATDPAQELSVLGLVSTINAQAAVNAILDVEFLDAVGQEGGLQQ